MIKRATIMTIDYIVRVAAEIHQPNEITNFNSLGIAEKNISAVSWELRKHGRGDGTINLLGRMAERLCANNEMADFFVFLQLSGSQPDNRIIRYKKTWGLLKARGYDVENLLDKIDVITDTDNGLILSGFCRLSLSHLNDLKPLINSEKNISFGLFVGSGKGNIDFNVRTRSDWMKLIWLNNGVVFYILGALDESDCEVVALGEYKHISALI